MHPVVKLGQKQITINFENLTLLEKKSSGNSLLNRIDFIVVKSNGKIALRP